MNKYTLKFNDISQQGGITRLERDGFKREQIMKTLHKEMQGATKQQKDEVVARLFDRRQ